VKNPKVDAYIERTAPFARAVLERLREAVHTACPDVEETIKWGVPHYEHKGVLCGTAAFKAHIRCVVWKSSLIKKELGAADQKALAQLFKMTGEADLPGRKALVSIFKMAAQLNDAGVKIARPKPAAKAPVVVPSYLKTALTKAPKAKTAFDAFSPSHKREYVDWLTEAKTEETRNRRLAMALTQMAAGKSRHWKYQR
jgi:hypothetical protein